MVVRKQEVNVADIIHRVSYNNLVPFCCCYCLEKLTSQMRHQYTDGIDTLQHFK